MTQEQIRMSVRPNVAMMDPARFHHPSPKFPTYGWNQGYWQPLWKGNVASQMVALEDQLQRHPSSRLVAPGYKLPELRGPDVERMLMMPSKLQPWHTQLREPRSQLRGQISQRWQYQVTNFPSPFILEMPGLTNVHTTLRERDMANPFRPALVRNSYGYQMFAQNMGQTE